MAKRTIRKTDPDNTTAPEGRAAAPNGAAPRARTGRSRKASGAATGLTAAGPATVPEGTVEAPDAARGPGLKTGAPIDVPHDHIAVRAYHLYLKRGGRGGDDFHDWITAERELREQAAGHRLP